MIDWLKNKKHPEFWKTYLQKQEEKSSRYVTLSVQTTGLNPVKDVILTVGAVGIQNNELVIKDSFEVVLLQYIYNHDNGFSNEFIIESTMPKSTALHKLDCGKLKNEALDIEIMFKKWKEFSDDKKFSVTEIAQNLKLPTNDSDLSIDEAYIMGLCFLKLKKYLRIE